VGEGDKVQPIMVATDIQTTVPSANTRNNAR
jgi:hypothetical protein